MTALVCAFSRAFHSLNNEVKIYDDSMARRLLTDAEYSQISESMSQGIAFFNPSFHGAKAEGLRWIVDNQLSPSVLARSAYAEKCLAVAVGIGAEQYLILAAGYDTFAYRQPAWGSGVQIFEIDHPATAEDKQKRLRQASLQVPKNVHFIEADFMNDEWQFALTNSKAFHTEKISFCTLLGVTYYLSKPTFVNLIRVLGSIVPKGSSVVFDYPDDACHTSKAGERAQKQAMLAKAAGEEMLSCYSYKEIERLLSDSEFAVYEHLTPQEMTDQYFDAYNKANPLHPMRAFDNANYCLAVKK